MTFLDITRTMLSSMDFFELRRTAARYNVAYQGIRRQKLMKDIEGKIMARTQVKKAPLKVTPKEAPTVASASPMAAVSAKPKLTKSVMEKKVAAHINTFSARSMGRRVQSSRNS